tara:strand:+ start:42 stop:1832 length:1791 start_codon:yes stop_codon:yes gene_type:complete
MKWIGQNIYDFISRFRNDVFLEDVKSGTIASASNLGLDSNNKIVKATITSHDEVTLAGTPDYITISGQEITRNAVDLTADVTGTLPVANGGTGLTSLSTLLNSNVDHDTLTNFAANEHFTQANITTVGTIGTGVWQGTAINATYLDGQSGTNTGDETLSSVNGLGVTTVGTIDTGVWQGTAIASAYLDSDTAHLTTAQTFTGVKTFGTTTKLQFRDANAYINSPEANDLEIAATDITLDAAGIVTVEADNLYVSSANANDPLLNIINSANDATSGRLRFLNARGADGQDDDETGIIEFFSYDDGTPAGERYSRIIGTIHDATAGQESGRLTFQVASHDGGDEDGLILTGGSADAEVDVTIGNGAASVVTIPGHIDLAGDMDVDGTLETDALTIGGATISAIGTTNIRTLGTVVTGVWNATKILSAKTTHVIHYPFRGYAAGIASGNFQFSEDFADPQSPFQMNQDYGDTVIADGSLPDVSNWFRSSITVMPRAVTAVRLYGWATCGGTNDITISLCKITPTRNNNGAVVPIVVATSTFSAIDNDKMEFFNVTGSDAGTGTGSIVTSAIAQGDILMPFVITPNAKTLFFNMTLEVEG